MYEKRFRQILRTIFTLNQNNLRRIPYLFSNFFSINTPEEDGKLKPKVSMVCWDRSDKYVVTAVHDATFKVWDSVSGQFNF